MLAYSAMLVLALAVSAPWWAWRMFFSGRYRAGLSQRLGIVPPALRALASGKRVIWIHAVSVGEVFASVRLVRELENALPGWVVVVSTTTATGQKIARERFGSERVFYFPLDFAFAVKKYMLALNPRMVLLMESELWPRLITECDRASVPVTVVNARISDRSIARYLLLRRLWKPLLLKVRLFVAQGEETGARLRSLNVSADRIRVSGNLKYDLPPPAVNLLATRIAAMPAGRGQVIVAGSTLSGEERIVVEAWRIVSGQHPASMLILAPRHPDRFDEVRSLLTASGLSWLSASAIQAGVEPQDDQLVVLLDTLGDLAALYSLASVAFLGGSLVAKGGHNPLEAARFGVPVVMGASYENFREMVEGMRAANAIRMLPSGAGGRELADALLECLATGPPMGERGREFYESQAGATHRTVRELLALLGERSS